MIEHELQSCDDLSLIVLIPQTVSSLSCTWGFNSVRRALYPAMIERRNHAVTNLCKGERRVLACTACRHQFPDAAEDEYSSHAPVWSPYIRSNVE